MVYLTSFTVLSGDIKKSSENKIKKSSENDQYWSFSEFFFFRHSIVNPGVINFRINQDFAYKITNLLLL